MSQKPKLHWILQVACTTALGCAPATVDGTDPDNSAGQNAGSRAVSNEPEAVSTVMTPAMPPPSSAPTGVNGDGQELQVDSESDVMKPKPVDNENACAATELAPEEVEVEVEIEVEVVHEELKPVAIYVVLDNSQSMNDGGGGFQMPDGASRWEQAVEALTTFVSDPASEGIAMAIQYFHPLGVGEEPNECDGSGHAVPHVEMGILPENAPALLASLDEAAPVGYTPTVGALTGGVQYCQAYQEQDPSTSCVVVLVTDGVPVTCGLCESETGQPMTNCFDEESENVLAPIASEGLAANVKTFTVGMDGISEDGFGLLNAIAAAGGTDCNPELDGNEACDVSTTGAQGFADALNGIRDTVSVTEIVIETETKLEKTTLACEWGIPDPPEGDIFYPDLVNVTLAVEGGEPSDIGGVASLEACAESGGFGWYYDNPEAPTLIRACPESCAEIEGATDPVVEVLLGCKTLPPVPK